MNLCRTNSKGRYALFSLVRKKYKKSTRRVCAPSRLPWGWGTICTFFACTKKVPKKYTEGLRALLTPGNAVKLRLRFAPQVLRRYWKFHSMRKRKICSFSLPLSDSGLTHRCFFEFLGFCYMEIWFISEFVRLNLCRINGHGICERLNLLFLLARPRKLERRFAALATAG